MKTSSKSLKAIQGLRAEKKFVARNFYPGAPNEETRLRCEARVNQFLNDVLGLSARGASKDEVLLHAKNMLNIFSKEDTEERERADDYVGEAMRSMGLDDWKNYI